MDKKSEPDITGKYIRRIVNTYCVLDLETTGLSYNRNKIIEVGILKVENDIIVDRFSQLINPEVNLDPYITELTGITNDMLIDKPIFDAVLADIIAFIGSDIIIGHNTNFDYKFLQYHSYNAFSNKYIDTVQLARKVYPDLPNHKLSTLTAHLHIHQNNHRAIDDCLATKELYDNIKQYMNHNNLKISDLFKQKKWYNTVDIETVIPTHIIDNRLENIHFVFTGPLEKMNRKKAMQTVVNFGGYLDKTVNKNTNYLVVGKNKAISSKEKRARELQAQGQNIVIIDELTFYKLLDIE